MDRRARFACKACRRLKRKCPKELPSCSLCLRLERRCEYLPRARYAPDNDAGESATNSQSSNGEVGFQSSNNGLADLNLNHEREPLLRTKGIYDFPAMFFLDSEVCLQPLSSELNQAMPSVSSHNIPAEALAVYDKYFSTIHHWLPILSKKIARRYIGEDGLAPDSPSQLLFLCMKLVSEPPSSSVSPRTCMTYARTLETLLKVENSCLPCLQLLQSIILIAIYEIGHAIYPAAYLRVGYASRLCIMMGFHDRKNANQLFKDAVGWTGREEERRAWWAVFCLDRIMNQGTIGMLMSTPEPSPGELLPCPEQSWNEGGIGFNEPLFAASFSSNTSLGSFANVCQAAHILSRALHHRNHLHDSNITLDFRISEAKQLHNILTSLSSHLIDIHKESPSPTGPIIVAIALCFSARLILYEIYACNEKFSTDHGRSSSEAEMQRNSMSGILDVAENTWQLSQQILYSIDQVSEDGLSNYSPLLCHCLYTVASECEWLFREQEDSSAKIWLRDIVDLLKAIGKRWHVAGAYLSEVYKWPGYNRIVKT
ncbi:uncharacterized protein GGS22DRAFT_73651 [Annulohypoxylon maeteangense]|uniref:uncharacterized protein n=1 Tax=Annulohypoxylon maeteangense TaxID=1927788 RepID=UPI0020081994|nr:uncharacterized protein GGS22DRAFT_73651 [Annulohypoxylon maeteangense]KAI0881325.1 hypothetical protein GGS22DRAFT_73651 [Annulohypoxylon maeteangense]